jgi:hypothetical protein
VTKPSKSLSDALAESPVAALLARCRESEQAGRLIAGVLSDLGGQMVNCLIRDGTLLVSVTSTAQAAKLRQAVPRLLLLLREEGFDLNEIRVRVQLAAAADPNAVPPPERRANDTPAGPLALPEGGQARSALEFSEKLALTLRPSPLRDAALRLGERLRRQLARHR